MKSAIVGCGGISRVHAKVISDSDFADLIACADIIPERAAARAEEYGIAAYTDYIEMLEKEKPDVLHICTPHYLHVPMAIEALRRGINVFMEKPAAISHEQFAMLRSAAESSSAKIGICFQNRFNPTTKMMLEELRSDRCGKVLGARAFVTWKRLKPYYTDSGWRGSLATEGGSVLINQSIHTLDLLVYLLGEPAWVEAASFNRHLKGVIETEDTFDAYIGFKSGAHALFYATTAYETDSPVLLEVVTENRTIRFEGDDITITDRTTKERVTEHLENDAALGKSYWGSGHPACIGAFYASLTGDRAFEVGIGSVEDTMELMFAAYRSASENRKVEL